MVPYFGNTHCPGVSTSHSLSITIKASHNGFHWAAHAEIMRSIVWTNLERIRATSCNNGGKIAQGTLSGILEPALKRHVGCLPGAFFPYPSVPSRGVRK